jgi:hypothetical protein
MKKVYTGRDADLEQFIAWIGLQDGYEVPSGVAGPGQAALRNHCPGLVGDNRHVINGTVVDTGGKEAQKPVFTGDFACGVVRLDPDVVQMGVPVDSGLRIRLGHDEGGSGVTFFAVSSAGDLASPAEDPQAGSSTALRRARRTTISSYSCIR